MDTSSDKQAKYCKRGHGNPYEMETLRKTDSYLVAAQNNSIRTNYVKAKIDKTQQNITYRFCGDRDENINHKISKCDKQAPKLCLDVSG